MLQQNHLLYVGTSNTPTPTTLTINTIPATGPNKPVTISGTLRDSATNNGIAGKTITFTGTTGTTAVPPSVTTSSSGAFTTTATTVGNEGKFAARAQFAGDTTYNQLLLPEHIMLIQQNQQYLSHHLLMELHLQQVLL